MSRQACCVARIGLCTNDAALLALVEGTLVDEGTQVVRLAYDDWLEENGREDLSALVRLGERLAGTPTGHARRTAMVAAAWEAASNADRDWLWPWDRLTRDKRTETS